MSEPLPLHEAFGQAVWELVERGFTREELATKLGVKPTSLSRYVTGAREVPLAFLPVVEELLGRPRGYVLRLAGYVWDDIGLEEAIYADPFLDDRGRALLLDVYRFIGDRIAETETLKRRQLQRTVRVRQAEAVEIPEDSAPEVEASAARGIAQHQARRQRQREEARKLRNSENGA